MLAGHIVAPNRIEIVDAPEPDPGSAQGVAAGEGAILFQPELACLCGSDMPYFRGEKASYPLEVGYSLHEMIGTVVETTGTKFTVGERVLAVPMRQYGFWERYWLTERRAIRIDSRLRPEQAVLAQPFGTVLFGLKKIPAWQGLNVAVVGQGPIGQLFCAALRNVGAREIIALDRVPERLRTSPSMGATVTVNVDEIDAVAAVAEVTGGEMADVVVEAVGHEEQALNFCAELCRRAGRILYFGVPPERIDGVEWSRIFFKNLSIHTTVDPSFEDDFPLAMKWIGEGRVDVMPIVTHRFGVHECQRAFETFRDRRDGALKVFLEFPSV